MGSDQSSGTLGRVGFPYRGEEREVLRHMVDE